MNYTLTNEMIKKFNQTENKEFPIYTTQLMNLANQNAQGTRPKIVGQLSELFHEFIELNNEYTIQNWEKWYKEKYPNALNNASQRILLQIQKLKEAINKIDQEMIESWVKDLIINKTFNGLYFQKSILASLAEKKNCNFRLANPDEEAKGIDGFVGEIAYSIKPDSYKTNMNRLPESIDVKMIYYKKTKTSLKIEVED